VAELVRRLSSRDADFDGALAALTAWDVSEEDAVTRAARDIVEAVRARGDAALLEYTRRFDRLTCASVAELELGPDDLAACARALTETDRSALQQAAQRIRTFHEAQRQDSF
jgi:histidinol dehydrogenase